MKLEFATIRAARAFYATRRLNRSWPMSLAVACCGYPHEVFTVFDLHAGPECVFGELV
jgi:hypothetical protein